MSTPGPRPLLVLDEAFVAAAPVHEPTAAERAARVPVSAVAGAVAVAVRPAGPTNLDLYRRAVTALVALFLVCLALSRLGL